MTAAAKDEPPVHTPGPWEWTSYGELHGRDHTPVLRAKSDRYDGDYIDWDNEADAALIAQAPALAAEVERLRYALGLVLVGLKNGHVKAKPIFPVDFAAETMQPQSLEQIIEAALARQEATGSG